MPLEADIGLAYVSYYTHGDFVEPRTRIARILFSLLRLEREREQMDVYYLNEVQAGRLLEIGFGDGRRLEKLAALGWRVEGQEMDPVAVRNARTKGFLVHQGPLKDLGLVEGSFDAIVGGHVLEHVHDPVAFLKMCLRLLKPGGRLVMVTPNTMSYGHTKFRCEWRGLEPPRHLHIFNPRSITCLVRSIGLSDIGVHTTPARVSGIFSGSLTDGTKSHRSWRTLRRIRHATRVGLHVVLAWRRYLREPNSGDEMVLIGHRAP